MRGKAARWEEGKIKDMEVLQVRCGGRHLRTNILASSSFTGGCSSSNPPEHVNQGSATPTCTCPPPHTGTHVHVYLSVSKRRPVTAAPSARKNTRKPATLNLSPAPPDAARGWRCSETRTFPCQCGGAGAACAGDATPGTSSHRLSRLITLF